MRSRGVELCMLVELDGSIAHSTVPQLSDQLRRWKWWQLAAWMTNDRRPQKGQRLSTPLHGNGDRNIQTHWSCE